MAEITELPAELPPNYVASLVQQAVNLASENKFPEAFNVFAQAMAIDPGNPAVLMDYGGALANDKKWDMAVELTKRGLEAEGLTNAQKAVGLHNLGGIAYGRRDLDAAIGYFDQSIALMPDYVMPLVTKGAALCCLKRIDEAYALFDRANLLAPTDWIPIMNRGMCRLFHGDWTTGMPGYEHRFLEKTARDVAEVWKCPRWRGEDLTGRNIVTWPDQGFGDCIWTHRLLAELAKRGARNVYFAVYPQIEAILPVPPGVTLVHPDDQIEQNHFHVPNMSLPACLKIDPRHPPAPTGIVVPADVRAKWAHIREEGKFHVGVCWSGNINHKFDDLRSIPFRSLAWIEAGAEAGSLSCHALQRDVRPHDKAALEASSVHWHGEKISTFADVAAITEHMDLVITVDTSILHLAAEMGKPTWGLIPFHPDWRWGLDSDRTPWYPTLRLYRKENLAGPWDDVLARVRRDLEGKLNGDLMFEGSFDHVLRGK